MDIGTRAAYKVRGEAVLGVVINAPSSSQVTLKLDNGKTMAADTSRLYRVDYWRNRNTPIEFERLKQIDPTLSALEVFKRKRAIVFDTAALRSAWYWGNAYIFNHRLKEPDFVVGEHKGLYGRYRKQRGQSVGTIWASRARNHNIGELFATVIHEQIHQYNWEVELEAGDFDPQEGSHGSAFMSWIPIVRQKTGVVITVKGDANLDTTQYEDTSEEAKTAPFIFALLHFNQGWLGFILKNKHELDSFAGTARQALIVNKSEDRKVYSGISNLARIKSGLYNAKRGQLNLNRVKHNVSASIVHLIHNTAKPIDGYLLPKPE